MLIANSTSIAIRLYSDYLTNMWKLKIAQLF